MKVYCVFMLEYETKTTWNMNDSYKDIKAAWLMGIFDTSSKALLQIEDLKKISNNAFTWEEKEVG